jgi:hypothetical protein
MPSRLLAAQARFAHQTAHFVPTDLFAVLT